MLLPVSYMPLFYVTNIMLFIKTWKERKICRDQLQRRYFKKYTQDTDQLTKQSLLSMCVKLLLHIAAHLCVNIYISDK